MSYGMIVRDSSGNITYNDQDAIYKFVARYLIVKGATGSYTNISQPGIDNNTNWLVIWNLMSLTYETTYTIYNVLLRNMYGYPLLVQPNNIKVTFKPAAGRVDYTHLGVMVFRR